MKISADQYFDLTNPQKRYKAMADAVQFLLERKHYVATLCLVACYLDEMSTAGRHTAREYLEFLERQFPDLCRELGAQVFYSKFRCGLVHEFSPETGFAVAEDREARGAYTGRFEVEGREDILIGLNVERLAAEFIALARKKAEGVTGAT